MEAGAWDAGAEAWIELVRSGEHGVLHDTVVRELLPEPAGLALDVGCGEGRWTRGLAALGHDVVGLDRSDALIDAARNADPNGRYEVTPADVLPVGDGEAALVLCVNVLMHVVDLDAALAEFARVLAPGGVLVAAITHPVMEAGTFDEETGELRLHSYFAAEEHVLPLGEQHVIHQHRTIAGYMSALLAAGFTLADLREVPGRTGGIPRYLDLKLSRR